jgi:hypothetical protein
MFRLFFVLAAVCISICVAEGFVMLIFVQSYPWGRQDTWALLMLMGFAGIAWFGVIAEFRGRLTVSGKHE